MRSLRITLAIMLILALFSGCVTSVKEKPVSENILEEIDDLEKDLDLLEEFDSTLKDLESLEVPEVPGTY